MDNNKSPKRSRKDGYGVLAYSVTSQASPELICVGDGTVLKLYLDGGRARLLVCAPLGVHVHRKITRFSAAQLDAAEVYFPGDVVRLRERAARSPCTGGAGDGKP